MEPYLDVKGGFDRRRNTRSRLADFKRGNRLPNDKKPEKLPKFITQQFSDKDMHEFIEKYYDRQKGDGFGDKSSLFSTTLRSFTRNACVSVDRETRDNRFLENYENNRKRWQKYASVLSQKVGRKSPEQSVLNSSDFYIEDLQKKEDFDEVQDKNIQRKLNGWYGSLRLSPLDGKLNRNFVPMGKNGYIGASEILHNKSRLLMKKPKDFFLFGNKWFFFFLFF